LERDEKIMILMAYRRKNKHSFRFA